jgi:hypothetical protein
LYDPAAQGEQAEAEAHATFADVRHPDADENATHVVDPATLPVPVGHAWHTLVPVNIANVPAEQGLHTPATAYFPGTHPIHVVMEPPVPGGQTAHVAWPIPV